MASVEEHVTTALDVIATLLAAAGVVFGLWPLIHGWSVLCGGVALGLCVRVIDGGAARLLNRFRKGST